MNGMNYAIVTHVVVRSVVTLAAGVSEGKLAAPSEARTGGV